MGGGGWDGCSWKKGGGGGISCAGLENSVEPGIATCRAVRAELSETDVQPTGLLGELVGDLLTSVIVQ